MAGSTGNTGDMVRPTEEGIQRFEHPGIDADDLQRKKSPKPGITDDSESKGFSSDLQRKKRPKPGISGDSESDDSESKGLSSARKPRERHPKSKIPEEYAEEDSGEEDYMSVKHRHNPIYQEVENWIPSGSNQFKMFKTMCRTFLTEDTVSKCDNVRKLLHHLEEISVIGVGKYDTLYTLLKRVDAWLTKIIKHKMRMMGDLGRALTDKGILETDASKDKKLQHYSIFVQLHKIIPTESSKLRIFKSLCETSLSIERVSICEDIIDLLNALEEIGVLGVGNYSTLKKRLACVSPSAVRIVEEHTKLTKSDVASTSLEHTVDTGATTTEKGIHPTGERENPVLHHYGLFVQLNQLIQPMSSEMKYLRIMSQSVLPWKRVSACRDVIDLLYAIEEIGELGVGRYDTLKAILTYVSANAVRILEEHRKFKAFDTSSTSTDPTPDKETGIHRDKERLNAAVHHYGLFANLAELIQPGSREMNTFRIVSWSVLPRTRVSACEDVADLLYAIEEIGELGVGRYDTLKAILTYVSANAVRILEEHRKFKASDTSSTSTDPTPDKEKWVHWAGERQIRAVHHYGLFSTLDGVIQPMSREMELFRIVSRRVLRRKSVSACKDVADLLYALQEIKFLDVGQYDSLEKLLTDVSSSAVRLFVEHQAMMACDTANTNTEPSAGSDMYEKEKEIHRIGEGENPAIYHYGIFIKLAELIQPWSREMKVFRTVSRSALSGRSISDCDDVIDLLYALEKIGVLGVGKYDSLKKLLTHVSSSAVDLLVEHQAKMTCDAGSTNTYPMADTGMYEQDEGTLSGAIDDITLQHYSLFCKLHELILPGNREYTLFRTSLPFSRGDVIDRLIQLEDVGSLGVGKYATLKKILKDISPSAVLLVEEHEMETASQTTNASGAYLCPTAMTDAHSHREASEREMAESVSAESDECVIHVCTSHGGIFTYSGSNTKLLVPVGAVAADSVDIRHRTIYDVHGYTDEFKLPEDHIFASPIIELSCPPTFSGFEKRVSIFLPMCEKFRAEDVRVYRLCDGKVDNVLPRNSHGDQGSFFTVDGHGLRISTRQFSRYAASTCICGTNDLQLSAYVYSKPVGNGNDVRGLRLFLCDPVHSVQGFLEVINKQEKMQGFIYRHRGRVDLLDEVRNEDEVSAEFQSTSWKLANERVGATRVATVSDILTCKRRVPMEIGTWHLNRKEDGDGSDTIYIVHRRGEAQRETYVELLDTLNTDFDSKPREEEGQAPTSERHPLPSVTLHYQLLADIGKAVPHNTDQFRHMKEQLRAYLAPTDLEDNKTFYDFLNGLETGGHIPVGDYGVLKRILCGAGAIDLENQVQKRELEITQELAKEDNLRSG